MKDVNGTSLEIPEASHHVSGDTLNPRRQLSKVGSKVFAHSTVLMVAKSLCESFLSQFRFTK